MDASSFKSVRDKQNIYFTTSIIIVSAPLISESERFLVSSGVFLLPEFKLRVFSCCPYTDFLASLRRSQEISFIEPRSGVD